ncbi:uncharacterized protein LOC107368331 [Tetranychus urticae]|uniref:Uncharacterized protein n=1 Tax=Tetranychus urticae TaxID=32264 RepID=T1KXN3_TETUR|nr:uncharacterized protein LOC107368331 [Tetranychus urticae]
MTSGFANVLNRLRVPVVIAATGAYYGLDIYKSKSAKNTLVEIKLDGGTIPGITSPTPSIQPPLQEIIDEVKSKLNLPKIKKDALNFYGTPFPIPQIHGFYSSYSQIDVFLPDYLNLTNSEQLTGTAIRNLVKLLGYDCDTLTKEDWLTPDGVSLINSFFLSKRAKKFLVTQTSYSNFNYEYFFKHLIFGLTFTAGLAALGLIEERMKGTAAAKLVVTLFMLVPVISVYFIMSNHAKMICESKGIAQAVSRNMLSPRELHKLKDADVIDEEMLLGGIEYYTKLSQREKALLRLFNTGFSLSGMVDQDGEPLKLFVADLPKKEVIALLEKVHSLMDEKSSAK